MHSKLPYVRPDGVRVAVNWDDLTDGTLLNPITVTASGLTLTSTQDAGTWTNTAASGATYLANDCQGWTANPEFGFGSSAHGGMLGRLDRFWTQDSQAACNYYRRLYCFEQ